MADLAYVVRAFVVDNVNLKTVGTITVLTARSQWFIPHRMVIHRKSVSGTGAISQVDLHNGSGAYAFAGRQVSAPLGTVQIMVPDEAVDSAGEALNLAANGLILEVAQASGYTTDLADFEIVGTLR